MCCRAKAINRRTASDSVTRSALARLSIAARIVADILTISFVVPSIVTGRPRRLAGFSDKGATFPLTGCRIKYTLIQQVATHAISLP